MLPHKLRVSLTAKGSTRSILSRTVAVFHDWIASQAGDNEVLVDVADYRHVTRGPGLVLVGRGFNYSLREHQDRVELSCLRKCELSPGLNPLVDAVATTLRTCERLEDSLALRSFGFDTNRLELSIFDRRAVNFGSFQMDEFKWATKHQLSFIYGSLPEIEVLSDSPRPTLRARWLESKNLRKLLRSFSSPDENHNPRDSV